MNRRLFLTALSALPFCGWLKPAPEPEPTWEKIVFDIAPGSDVTTYTYFRWHKGPDGQWVSEIIDQGDCHKADGLMMNFDVSVGPGKLTLSQEPPCKTEI